MGGKALTEVYRGLPVLIPGGAGFIGSRLAMRLANMGAAVTLVDPFNPHGGANPFHLKAIRDRIELIEVPIEYFVAHHDISKFRLIFDCVGLSDHFIGFKHPGLDYQLNCAAGLVLLRSLEHTGTMGAASCRLVSLGSRNQYGGRAGQQPIFEDEPLAPADVQSIHKTTLEHFHRLYSKILAGTVELVFLRLTNTYGPGQRMSGSHLGFVGELLRKAIDNEELVIYGHLDRVKDLLYVDDVVDALVRIGGAGSLAGVFNLGGQPCRISELLSCIEARLGVVKWRVEDFPEAVRRLDTGDAVLASGRLHQACGWSPITPVAEGIARTLDYYITNKRHYWSA